MAPPKVFVTRRIPESGLARLREQCQVVVAEQDAPIGRVQLEQGITDADALLCMLTDRIDDALLALAPRLKIVANYAVGTNNIDIAAATARGIAVANTPDVLTDATADLTWGLILDVARGITAGDKATRRGEFKGWAPLYRLGREVTGKKLGIIGMGRIGQAVAQRALGFRMQVSYTQRRRLEEHPEWTYLDLESLLKESDIVSVHCPLNDETRQLLNAERLRLLKPTAVLINTSRGPVIDEAALVEALRAGKIAGAGLDVFEREPVLASGLVELDNVTLPPHLGSATFESRDAMALLAADKILAVLKASWTQNDRLM